MQKEREMEKEHAQKVYESLWRTAARRVLSEEEKNMMVNNCYSRGTIVI